MNPGNLFSKKYIPAGIVFTAFVGISFLLRIMLMISVAGKSNMHFWHYPVSLLTGLLYDVVMGLVISMLFVIHLWFQNEFIYRKKIIPVVIACFVTLIILLLYTHVFPKEYNKLVFQLVTAYVCLRFGIYLVLAFLPLKLRQQARVIIMDIMLLIAVSVMLLNAASEWFFWQEFYTRYNFIAVDYLIYTNEVIGNINESYPIIWIIAGIVLVSLIIIFLLRRRMNVWIQSCESFGRRTLKALCLLVLTALLYTFVPASWYRFSGNEYANEIGANGPYQFVEAFKNNDLDFFKFYRTIPDDKAFSIVRNELSNPGVSFTGNGLSIERNIVADSPEKKMNVVLISIESLSAIYMEHFGYKNHITPCLDSLADKSLFFTQHYASGTRTVRGLEALTLSMPPVPGQSIIKRPDNKNMFTIGSVFRSKGYITQFIYGGYSYFDNMQAFFGGNGYEVIDRNAIPEKDIHYSNIWGVADEDEFTLAINTLDKNYASKKPFFTHIMTVSNHRPFTYPDGRIDIPSSTQSREGAVKYTDYCIGKFLKDASKKPWYNNTIFVIVADHCASAAGSVDLPVTGYHIPLMIFSPANLQPRNIDEVTAQIDIAPTILGLLNFSYRSKFFGEDMLNPKVNQRQAFISTYQGLGFLQNNDLVIQSPVKKLEQFKPDFVKGTAVKVPLNDSLAQKAIAFYQVAAWLVKNGKYNQ